MKRMKKVLAAVVAMTMAFALMVGVSIPSAAADSDLANRMNVVFVLDQSGSMKTSDSAKLRYEAMDLFLGLATEEGNYMGAVVFDEGIVLKQDIQEIKGKSAKNGLSSSVRNADSNGDTNIGLALETATQMLQAGSNSNLDSAIILLSDGNTDLGKGASAEEMTASLQSKANAIANAQNNGIKVYSVCLNTDGSASKAELEEISNATGGACVEVKTAEDLKNVFSLFYNMIYSTETVALANGTIPANGELQVPFTIPPIGVEEANIIINTISPGVSYDLTRPGGAAVTPTELSAMEIESKTFKIIKIQKPDAGEWVLTARGVAGDQVRIDMVYNSDLDITASSDLTGNAKIGDEAHIEAQILNNGTAVSDPAVYQSTPIMIRVTDSNGGSYEEEMTASGDRCTYTLKLDELKDYSIVPFVTIDGTTMEADEIHISVGNSAPVASKTVIEISEKYTPFSEDEYTEDLSQYVSDAEDTALNYQIKSSSMDASVASVDDQGVLTLKIKECGDGEMMVEVSDSAGASVSLHVVVSTTNLLMLILMIAIPILVIIIIVIIILVVKSKNKAIYGEIKVTGYSAGRCLGPVQRVDGGRGKMYLGRYLNFRENVGLNLGQVILTAGKKDSYIMLEYKPGLFTDMNPEKKVKSLRLDAEIDVEISTDPEFRNYIRIEYVADDGSF